MAADIPPTAPAGETPASPNPSSRARLSQVGNTVNNIRQNGVANTATDAAKARVTSAVTSRIPGSSAVTSAAALAKDFSAQNLVRAGAATADTAIKGALAATTGGVGNAIYAASKFAVKNKTTRYIIIGLIIALGWVVYSTLSSVYNSGLFGMASFYASNKGLVDDLNSLNDIKLETGLCYASGSGTSANASGQAAATATHTDANSLLEDCLGAKSYSEKVNANQDPPQSF